MRGFLFLEKRPSQICLPGGLFSQENNPSQISIPGRIILPGETSQSDFSFRERRPSQICLPGEAYPDYSPRRNIPVGFLFLGGLFSQEKRPSQILLPGEAPPPARRTRDFSELHSPTKYLLHRD
jgi:hypothetical protein